MDDEKVFIPEIVETGGQSNKQHNDQKAKLRIGCAFTGIGYLIIVFLGLMIYVWTIVIAYYFAGIFGAILSLIFPVFAQIFWGVKLWSDSGTIMNPYCLALIAYLVGTMFARIGFRIFSIRRRR